MAELRFYLDENVPVAVAGQLRGRGIGVVTARDLGVLHDDDDTHLRRASTMGYVLCTHDVDFVQLARAGMAHAGILVGHPVRHGIGDWVRGLMLYHATYTAEEMLDRVEFL